MSLICDAHATSIGIRLMSAAVVEVWRLVCVAAVCLNMEKTYVDCE
jgi:hypothetical protein